MTDQLQLDSGPEIVYVEPDGSLEKKGRGKVETKSKKVWPAELLVEAERLLDKESIDDGGDYREDEKGKVYWLDLDHLVEFEKADARIDTDKDFWSWFKTYREKHAEIKSKRARVRWDDYYTETKPKGDYFTSWWSGWGYGHSDKTAKLAIALRAVQSIVSVISDIGQRFRVSLATADSRAAPASFTNFGGNAVIVSPQALLDTSISEEKGIRVTAGWGLHEGSHVRWTVSVLDALTKPSELRPLAVASHLLNLLEDVRIEAKTSELFPGFASYFVEANDYLWDVTKQHAPRAWGPELGDKINAITSSVKWPAEFAPIAAGDPRLQAEFDWFVAWTERYKSEKKDARTLIIEALLHLNEDEQTQKQLAKQDREEQDAGAGMVRRGLNDKQFTDLLDQLREQLKDGKGKDLITSCPSPDQRPGTQVQLTPEQAAAIDQLLREELRRDQPMFGATGAKSDEITVTKPIETPYTIRNYRRPGPLLARLKQAFVFRKTAPDWYERVQRSGQLDEDELYRVLGNDFRVFERKITTDIPDTQITLLVDQSSSMMGNKIWQAQFLATAMIECLSGMKGIRARVRGHTTGGGVSVFRIWEPGDPKTRLGLLQAIGGTPEGYAIDWCGRELLENQRPGEDMVMIVLSDGQPGGGLNGMTGEQHVRFVVDSLARKNVTVIQIAVDSAVRPAMQDRMYRHWLPYEGEQKLPGQLLKLLTGIFGGVG